MIEEKFGIKITDIDLEHLFEGHWKKCGKRRSGFHSAYYHPEKVIKDTIKVSDNGVWKSSWGLSGKPKLSTYFPSDLSPEEIIKKVIESFENIETIIKVHDGTRVRCFMIHNSKRIDLNLFINGNGIVETVFPLMGGEIV